MTAIVQWRAAECDNCMDIKPCRRVTLGDDLTAELCAECEPVFEAAIDGRSTP